MKIRIHANSIRYRLREPEVQAFKNFHAVSESIHLGFNTSQVLQFNLRKSDHAEITLEYEDQTTTIYVPETIANRWTDTDQVGFDAMIETGNGQLLKILVEKDFKCLDGSDEDNVGAYPNPAEHC
jgi:hypothetical protein